MPMLRTEFFGIIAITVKYIAHTGDIIKKFFGINRQRNKAQRGNYQIFFHFLSLILMFNL